MTIRYHRSDVKKSTILGIVMGALLVLIGIYAIYGEIVTALEASRVSAFQAVDAYVVDARVEKIRHRDDLSYKLLASYRYNVNGKEYIGNRIWLKDILDGDPTWPYSWLAILTKAKKANQPINIYVNPDLPHEAILDRTLRRDRIAASVFLAFIFSGGGLFIIYKMVTVKIGNANDVSVHAEREQMMVRTSFEKKYGSMIVLFAVVLIVISIFLNYSRNMRDSNLQEEQAVYAPLAIDEKVGDYYFKRGSPGSIPLPTSFPDGAANPDFCRFVGAKSSDRYAEYSLDGTMEIGIYQAGDRINAHMIKSRWKPYDFIKQSDAVVMIYFDEDVELSYTFLVDAGKPNGCHIMWRPRRMME